MARIVSLKKVMAPGACKVFTYKGKKRATCKGAIGILTSSQYKTFVEKPRRARKKAKKVVKRWKKFETIAKKCKREAAKYHRPKKGRVFRRCMSREAKKATIRL